MDQQGWTIGEVARRAGMRPSALRYYESVGLLPAPGRVSGRRRYEPDILRWLAMIEVSQRAGFTVAEIRTLLHGFSPRTSPSARWRVLARRKLPEVEALITRARVMKRVLEEGLRCGCLRLEHCALLQPAAPSAMAERSGGMTVRHRPGVPSAGRSAASR